MAKTDWVAFVDDDDTISPFYINYFVQFLEQQNMTRRKKDSKTNELVTNRRISANYQSKARTIDADVLVSRMQQNEETVLPPLEHGGQLMHSCVGISFMVKR